MTILNHKLTAVIHPKGAELKSLKSLDKEFIWQGDPQYWAKSSPVLFPIVGTLHNNSYEHKGKKYHLPRHGFARDSVFEVLEKEESRVVFQLEEGAESLEVYPFAFRLKLIYELHENSLSTTYEVVAKEEDILFSIGGHPAFTVPHCPEFSFEDYALHFPKDEGLKRNKLQDGLLMDSTVELPLQENALRLNHSLFYEDAIVLLSLQSEEIALTAKGRELLRFHFPGFPHFGIWTAKDAPFLCLEPWQGHADFTSHNGHLAEKAGIVRLSAGEKWSRTWSVEIAGI